MARLQERSAEDLADAARRFMRRRGVTSTAEMAGVAKRWSTQGWQAVARVEGLDHVPAGDEMMAALKLLEAAGG